jgi:[acyl-carrier-protein] S-malonyltransferase
MAAGLRMAPSLFAAARATVGVDLEATCTSDPEPDWDPALIQPALFVVCTAAAQARLEAGHAPDAVLGHSFGEYAALVAAGALTIEDGLRLVVTRGSAMARLAGTDTGMRAVLGLSEAVVSAVCDEVRDAGRIEVANVNSPTQVVLSGDEAALEQAALRCKERGALRVRRLRVPYAAHSSLMEPARRELAYALADVTISPPRVPFYSGVTGASAREPDAIRALLAKALTSPVLFARAVRAAARDGHRSFVELGPGSPARLLGLVEETLAGLDVELALVADDDDARRPRPFHVARQRPARAEPVR